ncbi:MAG: formyltetrahydrofolate deformylase [Acidimicrobiales bacterium]
MVGQRSYDPRTDEYILIMSCPDRRGIVYAVAGCLAGRAGNILDSQQFGDRYTGRFFMRVHFAAEDPTISRADLEAAIGELADSFAMTWELHPAGGRTRVLVVASREGHCVNDLLYRARSGALPIDIPSVVSNHPDLGSLVATYGVPFVHLPVTTETQTEQERRLLGIVEEQHIDLVVLARYMRILSPEFCDRLAGRIINIHHSFLPSFKGGRPYRQAHDRGVKLIGATAHYVTADLDDGPIIEQEVARVDHALGPEQLAAVGRDLEAMALARAVRWHVEHRVLLNDGKTVVFA